MVVVEGGGGEGGVRGTTVQWRQQRACEAASTTAMLVGDTVGLPGARPGAASPSQRPRSMQVSAGSPPCTSSGGRLCSRDAIAAQMRVARVRLCDDLAAGSWHHCRHACCNNRTVTSADMSMMSSEKGVSSETSLARTVSKASSSSVRLAAGVGARRVWCTPAEGALSARLMPTKGALCASLPQTWSTGLAFNLLQAAESSVRIAVSPERWMDPSWAVGTRCCERR